MLFVDIADTVLPYLIVPFGGGQGILQHATAAIESCHLGSFLLERHLAQEVFNATLGGLCRIFIAILAAIFIKIDPAVMIDRLRGRLPIGKVQAAQQSQAAGGEVFHRRLFYNYKDRNFIHLNKRS